MVHTAKNLRKNLRISINDVRMGMFISSLDRPWSETAFELEGFLLTEASQLHMLRALVADVTIDLPRSAAQSYDHLPWDMLHLPQPARAAEALPATDKVRVVYASAPPGRQDQSYLQRLGRGVSDLLKWDEAETQPAAKAVPSAAPRFAASQPVPYYLRYESNPAVADAGPAQRAADRVSTLTPPSSAPFSSFIGTLYPRDVVYAPLNWLEQLRAWWGSSEKAGGKRNSARLGSTLSRRSARRQQRLNGDCYPPAITMVVYRDASPTPQDIAQARETIGQADQLMTRIARDIHADQSIALGDVRLCVDALVDSVISNPTALIWSARMRDHSQVAYAQGVKVAIYMMTLGRHLGFPRDELAQLGNIGLLLDVGMLKLPAEVRNPDQELNDAQNALLNSHVRMGLHMLQETGPLPQNIALGIAQHHERVDGSGYPHGISGSAISIYGKMAAIADTFVALTTKNQENAPHSAFDALKELFREAGIKWHAPLVEQFVQAISIFPIGSLIELSSGEVAIVLQHNRVRRLEPKVLILTCPDKKSLDQPYMLDLMKRNSTVGMAGMRILRGLPDGAYEIDYSNYYLP